MLCGLVLRDQGDCLNDKLWCGESKTLPDATFIFPTTSSWLTPTWQHGLMATDALMIIIDLLRECCRENFGQNDYFQAWSPIVGRPTRWSLLFLFGFLFWSSSWCLRPHIGMSFSVWPLLRAGMVVLDQFFSKMYFLYIWRSQNKNFTKFCEVLPPQKKVYFRTLGVSQKLWLNRPHFGIKYR